MRKTFTIGDLIDAVEKNGFKQTKGMLFKTTMGTAIEFYKGQDAPRTYIDYAKIGQACALGQAVINLGIRQDTVNVPTGDFNSEELNVYYNLEGFITSCNDSAEMRPQEIAERAREEFAASLDMVLDAEAFDYEPYIAEGARK